MCSWPEGRKGERERERERGPSVWLVHARNANGSVLARARVEHLAMPTGAVCPFFRGVEEFLRERITARRVQTRAFRAPLRALWAGDPT
jgi:hypothetical protein